MCVINCGLCMGVVQLVNSSLCVIIRSLCVGMVQLGIGIGIAILVKVTHLYS